MWQRRDETRSLLDQASFLKPRLHKCFIDPNDRGQYQDFSHSSAFSLFFHFLTSNSVANKPFDPMTDKLSPAVFAAVLLLVAVITAGRA
jgi:hypothetical protein